MSKMNASKTCFEVGCVMLVVLREELVPLDLTLIVKAKGVG